MNQRLHIGIIMDGNGRWAKRRGLPRTAGHVAGVRSLERVIEEAARLDEIDMVTCYAFSADNWKRPTSEVDTLMKLLRDTLDKQAEPCRRNGVRVNLIGRRDRLPQDLVDSIHRVEEATAQGTNLHLRLAVDYSARAAFEHAVALPGGDWQQRLARAIHDNTNLRDVDLVIRTAGEQRLSDFLLFEAAYAELYFVDKCWPEFQERDLRDALVWFDRRERKFGGLGAA